MEQVFLTALPVYNEASHIQTVLSEVRQFSREMLVVDDGSRDATPELLARIPHLHVVTHPSNQGYGAALCSAFAYAIEHRFDVLVTIDCDGQHQPALIPAMVEAAQEADIVSGSRYLQAYDPDHPPPEQRRAINEHFTSELNRMLGLQLTDAFCGFKAYRVEALRRLNLSEPGYGMPLELWVQAARLRLVIKELPVPLIYLEEHRSFGGALDDSTTRQAYYNEVLHRALR